MSFRSYVDGEFTLTEKALAEVARRQGELTVRFTREARHVEYRDGVALFRDVSIADD